MGIFRLHTGSSKIGNGTSHEKFRTSREKFRSFFEKFGTSQNVSKCPLFNTKLTFHRY